MALTPAWIAYGLAWAAAIAVPAFIFLWARKLVRQNRRLLMAAVCVLGTLVWGLLVWSTFIEPEQLVVRYQTISSPFWSGPPVRLGLIADTHVGAPHMTPERLARVVQRMNGEHPDLVLVLGDYAGRSEPVELQTRHPDKAVVLRGVAALSALKAPLGWAAVLGNHDMAYGPAAIRVALQAAGGRLLENSAVKISRPGGGDFWVAGVADLDSKPRPDPVLALQHAQSPMIIVAHEPNVFGMVRRPFALFVAGHTHCGQVNLPLIGRIAIIDRFQRRYACHLHARLGLQIYVSGGLGVSNLPVRFRAPPEINILTLQTSRPPAAL